MEQIIQHNSLKDLCDSMGIEMEQGLDFTIHPIQQLHPEPVTSPRFRANYFSFLFVETGLGTYTLDQQSFEVKPGTIYFTNPGHLKSFQVKEAQTGYIITLEESFLKSQVHRDVFDDFPFLLAETVPPGYLQAEEFQDYVQLAEQIYQEQGRQSPYKHKIMGNLFVVLLLKIKERFWQGYQHTLDLDRSSSIVNQFRRNLEQTYRNLDQHLHLPNVSDYANQQNLHPNYFNTVIRSKTGKSAHNWITEKTLAEARALLANPQLPIKEVAFRLKFSEATQFSKFFKKHTQVSPNTFRKSLTR